MKDSHEDDGKTVDMYHFKSRLDMILFAAAIIILLLIVVIYFQVTGTHPA